MMTASKYVKGCRKKRNTTKNTSGFWRKDQEEWTWNASRDGMLISEKIYIYPIESTGKQQNVYKACKMSVWAYSDHICQRGGSAMTQNCHGLGERVNILQISYRLPALFSHVEIDKGKRKLYWYCLVSSLLKIPMWSFIWILGSCNTFLQSQDGKIDMCLGKHQNFESSGRQK